MLAAMSPEQRELYEAEKEHKKAVKQAERELWWANSRYNLKVTSAEADVRGAYKQGQKYLDSYWGLSGGIVNLYENRISISHKEYCFENDPVRATVETTGNVSIASQGENTVGLDTRELYLAVEGSGFASTIQCRPDDGPKVRQLAAKINNASKSIRSVLQGRDQAIAQAQQNLEIVRGDRAGIEAATQNLEAMKNYTRRLDAARGQVEKALPSPSEGTTVE